MRLAFTPQGVRPGGALRRHTGAYTTPRATLRCRRALAAKASLEAPPAVAPAEEAPAQLSEKHLQLLQQYRGPLVKIATHYHVSFGDCLKVVGSSEEFGAWNAANAPLMKWGEGDVWSLVLPLPPGEHEFKVVVQQRSGNLIWESGDNNRLVSVPEDAPAGSMLVSVCAFNIIDPSAAAATLQPVTADVLELLEGQIAEEAAAEEAKAAAEAEQAVAEAEKARSQQAAAAVAKALATMDAEAEESGVRPRTMSDSDTDDAEPQFQQRTSTGPVVAAAGTEVALSPEQQQLPEDLAAAAEQLEAAFNSSSSEAGDTTQEEEAQEVLAAAADELQANMAAMSQEVHPDDVSDSHAHATPAAAVHAKLAQDKPVAVGFMDTTTAAAASSSVVAAFMKSVGGVESPAAAAAASDDTATTTAATSADASPSDTTATTTATFSTTDSETDSDVDMAETAAQVAALAAAAQVLAQPQRSSRKGSSGVVVAAAAVVPAAAEGNALSSKGARAASTDPGPLPKGWGPPAGASRSFASRGSDVSTSALSSASASAGGLASPGFSSSAAAAGPGTPPNSPNRHEQALTPGRGTSHVVSAAAAAAVAAEWIANVRASNASAAAREAEKAATELAARLQQAQQKKSEAAAEAERLHETMKHSSLARGRVVGGGGGGGEAAAVATPGNTMGFMAAPRSKARDMADAAMASSSSNPLSPPPVTPVNGNSAFAASAAAAAAGIGPSPPPVMSPSTGSMASRNVSTQGVSVNGSSGGGAGALTASGAFNVAAAAAEAEALERAERGSDGGWSDGMQLLAAVVGCAAVGTVLWSEFVLKETGCGLPPGPFGVLGAAEGLSYLTVLGFAGAGLGSRVNSGGKQGLQGPLAVPENLAYGALAAGLMVLAAQLHQYGYIPPPLPGGQCFADSAVAIPGAEELNNQLAAQTAALQSILAQLQSAMADGINQLHLQEQLAVLQAQVDAFSGYVSTQAGALDSQLQVGLLQLQDSLSTATTAVSSFVDTQMQQMDLSGKLAHVLDILRTQEQQLKVELPRQLAELQQLAATSMAVVQETALQASTSAHLPELLSSLDSVMAMLHGVLETRIQQLDVVLTQLQGSIGAAAAQLSAAVAAAADSGSAEAAAQLQGLQVLLSEAMSDVQAQVWTGYQQLELADKLSDMLLAVRTSASAVAASTAAEVDKLKLREQLQELEGLAGAAASALASNAMDTISRLQLDERLKDIAAQASAAAASLQAGLQQQYEQQLPAMEAQMASLQASLSGLASQSRKGSAVQGPELEGLLQQLQSSMESTMKLVGEVAATGVTTAGDVVNKAGGAATTGLAAVSDQLGAATDAVSSTLATSFPEAAAPSSVADGAAQLAFTVQDSAVAAAGALDAAAVTEAAAAVTEAAAAVPADAAAATVAAAAPAVSDAAAAGYFVVSTDPDAVAAVYGEALEGGMDFSQLVAYALPDHQQVLQSLPDAQTYRVDGVDLSEASDTIRNIWLNRPT